ncbi:hypothetical protein FHL15_005581 [Xylaria flabelliformis]|uniref:SnoaL-like domain-containing protein n=1 Tax=Xylaria flabelliformis TaxID=2512241 RepID=A0A553I077_9PEZI|nr:hypothetical protein FHL15_005581 [Xylaria flabelliformis]
MNINVPNLINAAFPERDTQNRNAVILSENSGPNHNEQGFLSSSFPRNPHKIFVTADSDDFDQGYLRALREEGFNVQYFGLGEGVSDEQYYGQLANLRNVAALGPCETFAVVAFGEAASLCLEFWHGRDNNPEFKLAALVAYYPSRIPDPRGAFPGGIRALAHLVDEEVGVVNHSQIVGIQGKRRVVKRAVKGTGVGGVASVGGHETNYPCYRYTAAAGFAEGDLDEFESVAADLAWSRSLETLRTAFRIDVEFEGVVEKNLEGCIGRKVERVKNEKLIFASTTGKFFTRNLGQTMTTYTTRKSPHATYFPTLSGGIGTQELRRFYADYFLSTNPESTKLTLISRTAGADRVVDELHLTFKHTQEMPWILPGVPPTNRRVEVVVISIVTLRGGKLYHEHVYWDQASVLVQVGLLDPKLIPEKARARGVRRLPVVGREAARRLVKGFEDDEDVDEGEADNELLPGWYDDDDEEEPESKGENGVSVGVSEKGKKEKERKSRSHEAQKTNGKKVDEPHEKEPDVVEKQNEQGDEPLKINGEEIKGQDERELSAVEEKQGEQGEPKEEKESRPPAPTVGDDDDDKNEEGKGPLEDANGATMEETS